METSHTRLAKTNTEYGNQAGLLGMSKRLLGVLHRQNVQVSATFLVRGYF